MAERFNCDFYDVEGIRWRVLIFDANHTGTSEAIRLTGEGFSTRWEGDETIAYSGIMPSSTTLEVANEGGDFAVFMSEVANMTEGDIMLEIWETQSPPTGTSLSLWWTGVVLIDGIQQEDRPAPTTVTLTAVDDLAQLKTVRWPYLVANYPSTWVSGPEGIGFILSMAFHHCRNIQNIIDSGGTSDAVLWTSVRDFQPSGYMTSQYGSTLPGPEVFRHATFGVGFDSSAINPLTGLAPSWFIWDVLQSIAVTFNLRIFMARGKWHAWPVNVHYMDSDEFDWGDRLYGYDVAGNVWNPNAGQLINFRRSLQPGIQLPNVGGTPVADGKVLWKVDGGTLSHTVPVKYVRRQQDWTAQAFLGQRSILIGMPDYALDDTQSLERFSFSDDRTFFAGSFFQFSGNVNVHRNASSYPGTGDLCRVKLDIVWDCGGYRWKGPDVGWDSNQTGSYTITVGSDNFSTGVDVIEPISFNTLDHILPADSVGMEFTATFIFSNYYGGDITSSLIPPGAYSTPQMSAVTILKLEFLDTENSDQLHYVAETSRANKVTIDQGSVLIGTTTGNDNFGGHIVLGSFFDGKPWVDPDGWHSYQDDTLAYHIHRLAVKEITAVHQVGRPVASGSLKLSDTIQALTPLVTIRTWDQVGAYDFDYWLPLTMSYRANSRTAEVTRLRLDWDGALTNVTDVTGDDGDPYVDDTDGGGSNPGDGGGSDPDNPTTTGGGGGTTSGPGSPGDGTTTDAGIGKGIFLPNTGKKLADIKDKTDHITVDGGNGITSITVKAGSKPLSADQVDDSTATNKFSTAAQLSKVDYLTVSASTDVDDLKTKSQAHFVALDLVNNNATARTGQVGVEVAWWDADGQLGSVGDGTSGQVLSTNGSGVLSWTTPAAGGADGWHGSTTAIKVMPFEFLMNDDYNRAPVMVDDTSSSTIGIKLPSNANEAYAFVAIPAGFDATHVQVHASASTSSAVQAYQYNHKTGAIVSKGSGAFNSTIDITDITSAPTASLVIKILPASASTLIYGATVTIAAT